MVNRFAFGMLIVSVGNIWYQENLFILEHSPFCTQSPLCFADHEKPPPFLNEVIVQIRMLSHWERSVPSKFCEAVSVTH